MIYNVFIGLAIGIVVSILIVGLICVLYLVGKYDPDECEKPSRKGKKK